MEFDDIELKLLINEPIVLDGVGNICSPTLKQAISMGYINYNQALSAILFNKTSIAELKDNEESNFLIACYYLYQDEVFNKAFSDGIRLTFGEEMILREDENLPYITLIDSGGRIDSSNFEYIQTLIKIANKIQTNKDEEFTPANNKAKALMDHIKKTNANRAPKKTVKNLHSLISGISWKPNGVNLFEISKLSIYQFYDGYYRLENIDHYNNMLTGIYTGNIDAKNIKMSEIDWAKVINS